MTFKLTPPDRRSVLKIVLIYSIFGGLWIYLSDRVLGMLVHDPVLMTHIATYKGLLFIVTTALLLYYLVGRYVCRLGESQRKLDDSAHQLKLDSFTFENISEAVYWTAPDSSIVFANTAACRMSGYSLKELLAMKVVDVDPNFPAEDWEPHWNELKQAGSLKLETTHQAKDGTIRNVEVVANYFRYLDKEYNCAMVRDISDRIRSENALRENQALLNATIESLPFDFFALDTSGRYVMQNATTHKHWGNVLGKRPEDIPADPSWIKRWCDNNRRALAGEEIQQETAYDLPDGRHYVLEVLNPIKGHSGEILGILGINIDQTEQKKAEQALRDSEENLRSLMSLMPVGMACTSSDGTMEYVNPGFVSRFGYDLDDVPTVEDWFQKAYPDSEYRTQLQSVWAEQFALARDHGIQIPPREVKVTCKDRKVLDVLITTQLSHNRLVAIFTDITGQEGRRQELIKNQKLESIGVLAGGIAHDFNNILTGILGNVSYARMFIDREHKAAKPLQEAERASQRAAELAQQLLTFSKGGQPVTRAVALRQVIEESVSLVLRGSNVTARVDAEDGLWAVEADEGQISQVFNNLVLNAVQSMPGGGVITIRSENIDIDCNNVLSIKAGRYVRVQVTDQGCGIPAENLKNIFDPYFTTKAGGSGLGLASVHSIVSKHGGYISVRSSEARGTTFEILLPASCEIPGVAATHHEIIAQADREFAILVMDDEEMIRDLTSEILTDFGYRVTTSSHGQEAIDLYRAAYQAGVPFQAVLMDLTVPGGVGGKEAAAAILEIDPQACLIVSSGYSNDPIVANYRAYGFCGAIIKPYTVNDLANALSALTTETTARREP